MEQVKVLKEFKIRDKDYIIVSPTLNITRESKYKYAKSFTDFLKQGFLTKKKMESVLAENNKSVYDDYITRRSELMQSMVELEDLIEKGETPEDLEYIANMLTTYRNLLLQEDMSMTSIFSNTADQLAEDERINFLVYSLVLNKDKNKLWKSEEEFQKETDAELVEACRYQVMCLDYNLKSDWDKDLPEGKASRKATELRSKKQQEELDVLKAVEDKKIEEQKQEKIEPIKKTRKRKPKQDKS
jgi:hypothetical protein